MLSVERQPHRRDARPRDRRPASHSRARPPPASQAITRQARRSSGCRPRALVHGRRLRASTVATASTLPRCSSRRSSLGAQPRVRAHLRTGLAGRGRAGHAGRRSFGGTPLAGQAAGEDRLARRRHRPRRASSTSRGRCGSRFVVNGGFAESGGHRPAGADRARSSRTFPDAPPADQLVPAPARPRPTAGSGSTRPARPARLDSRRDRGRGRGRSQRWPGARRLAAAGRRRAPRPRRRLLQAGDARPAPAARPLHRASASPARSCSASVSSAPRRRRAAGCSRPRPATTFTGDWSWAPYLIVVVACSSAARSCWRSEPGPELTLTPDGTKPTEQAGDEPSEPADHPGRHRGEARARSRAAPRSAPTPPSGAGVAVGVGVAVAVVVVVAYLLGRRRGPQAPHRRRDPPDLSADAAGRSASAPPSASRAPGCAGGSPTGRAAGSYVGVAATGVRMLRRVLAASPRSSTHRAAAGRGLEIRTSVPDERGAGHARRAGSLDRR